MRLIDADKLKDELDIKFDTTVPQPSVMMIEAIDRQPEIKTAFTFGDFLKLIGFSEDNPSEIHIRDAGKGATEAIIFRPCTLVDRIRDFRINSFCAISEKTYNVYFERKENR